MENPLDRDFEFFKEEQSRFGERNDCSVRAIAYVFEISYSYARDLLSKFDDRKPRKGSWFDKTMTYLAACRGWDVCKVRPIQPNGSLYTGKSIQSAFPTGRYLFYTSGHVFAMVNGRIPDFVEGRQHRIKVGWEINE